MIEYLKDMDFHVSPLLAALIVVVANLLLLLFVLRAKSDKRDFALYALICGDSFILVSIITLYVDSSVNVSGEGLVVQLKEFGLMFILGIAFGSAMLTLYKLVRHFISKLIGLFREREIYQFPERFMYLFPVLILFLMLQVIAILIQNQMIA